MTQSHPTHPHPGRRADLLSQHVLTLEAAIADLIESVRDHAQNWVELLQYAPNHADAWGLVQLVNLSTDEQVTDWLRTAE